MNHAESVRALVLETLPNARNTLQVINLQPDLGDFGSDSIGLSALMVSAESRYRVAFEYEHVVDMFRVDAHRRPGTNNLRCRRRMPRCSNGERVIETPMGIFTPPRNQLLSRGRSVSNSVCVTSSPIAKGAICLERLLAVGSSTPRLRAPSGQ